MFYGALNNNSHKLNQRRKNNKSNKTLDKTLFEWYIWNQMSNKYIIYFINQ